MDLSLNNFHTNTPCYEQQTKQPLRQNTQPQPSLKQHNNPHGSGRLDLEYLDR